MACKYFDGVVLVDVEDVGNVKAETSVDLGLSFVRKGGLGLLVKLEPTKSIGNLFLGVNHTGPGLVDVEVCFEHGL